MNPATVCKHLRTKKMYVPALAEGAFAQEEDESAHSSHCWCNCTLTETGPDDRSVNPQNCAAGRSCFEE